MEATVERGGEGDDEPVGGDVFEGEEASEQEAAGEGEAEGVEGWGVEEAGELDCCGGERLREFGGGFERKQFSLRLRLHSGPIRLRSGQACGSVEGCLWVAFVASVRLRSGQAQNRAFPGLWSLSMDAGGGGTADSCGMTINGQQPTQIPYGNDNQRRLLLGWVAGSPEVPGGYGAEGLPFFGSAFDLGGGGQEVGGELGGGLEAEVGEGEAFADAEVGGGEDVGAAETEDEEHLDRPLADAADLGEVVDDGGVGHAADGGEGGNGSVECFCGEVAEGEGFVVGEAGGAELVVGTVEDLLGRGVEERGVGVVRGDVRVEGADEAVVDGGRRFAVELLVDDGLCEGFEGGLLGAETDGEGAGFFDEAGEFGVGGGEEGGGVGG